jgi:hypothetical protein
MTKPGRSRSLWGSAVTVATKSSTGMICTSWLAGCAMATLTGVGYRTMPFLSSPTRYALSPRFQGLQKTAALFSTNAKTSYCKTVGGLKYDRSALEATQQQRRERVMVACPWLTPRSCSLKWLTGLGSLSLNSAQPSRSLQITLSPMKPEIISSPRWQGQVSQKPVWGPQ